MIIVFGVLSIFQLTFIPGLIITRLFKFQGFLINLIFALGISPIVNYLFVLLMTTLGIYTRINTLIIIGIEIVALFVVMIPVFKNYSIMTNLNQFSNIFFREYFESEKLGTEKGEKVIKVAIFTLASGMLIFFLIHYATQYSSVFTGWDAVVSWNRWAVDWFANHFPYGSLHYPQLIPANLSITYQLIGDERVQFFAKYFMSWIEIFVILTIFVIGLNTQKTGYFIAVIVTGWLQFVIGSKGSGYVDTPVSYWALLSITCLILANHNKEQKKYILLGALFAAGAAVTKQAGIWIALIYPILLLLLSREKKLLVKKIDYLFIGLIYLGIIGPWYGYIEYLYKVGNVSSEIPYITSIASHEKTFLETIVSAFKLLCRWLSRNFFVGIIELLLLSFFTIYSMYNKWCKKMVWIIILPMFLAWIYFFSYDIRNINIIVPFTGIAVGFGIRRLIFQYYKKITYLFSHMINAIISSKTSMFFTNIYKYLISLKGITYLLPMIGVFIILPLLIFAFLTNKYSDSYLISKSIKEQKMMGNWTLNEKLYDFQSEFGINGMILTDYQFLGFLPGLNDYYEYGYPNSEVFIEQFSNPKIGYALVTAPNVAPEIKQHFDQLVNTNKITILLEYDYYTLYSSCHGPCQ